MASTWEYNTLAMRVVRQRERGGSFFSHHGLHSNLDEASSVELERLGKEGWELVSVISLSSGPSGAEHAVGIFKRPAAS